MITNILGCTMPKEEVQHYVDIIRSHNPGMIIDSVTLKACDDGYVDATYHMHPVPFERVRRITGYLVGTLDRFNDAKRAEERDRVKHMSFS